MINLVQIAKKKAYITQKQASSIPVIETFNNKLSIIIDAVTKVTGIKHEVMMMKSRQRDIVIARHLCFYYAKIHKAATLRDVGWEVARRDHSLVLYGWRSICDLKIYDKLIKRLVDDLDLLINKHFI